MNTYNPKETYINTALIALNILYFIFLSMHGHTEYDIDMMVHYGAMYEPLVVGEKEYYRLLTACFMHFGIRHLLNNMVVLFAVGDNLERALGHAKYLLFYLLAGIGANLVSLYFHVATGEYVVSAGASGAIFGVVGGLLYAALKNRGRLEDLTADRLIIMIVLSIYLGLSESGVDNAAHIGGLLCGFLLCIPFYGFGGRQKKRDRGEWEMM